MSDTNEIPAMEEEEPVCGSGSPYNGNLKLRIAAIFIILVTSIIGTLLPIVSRRVKKLGVPEAVYQAVKYFGSGVILATAFIHLLAPAAEALGSECLTGIWTEYPWAMAISMMSVFGIFLVELIAHRTGASFLKRRGLKAHDHHTQGVNAPSHTSHGLHIDQRAVAMTVAGEEASVGGTTGDALSKDGVPFAGTNSSGGSHDHEHEEEIDEKAMGQIIGVAILEFGVIVHSLIIGLTLAVNDEFTTLFIVLIFHQMFEGLGLGSRLSTLPLPHRFAWVPYVAGTIYSCITPLGIAIGLGVRHAYNPDSANALIVSGVLDALSSGVLLYTALIELLAHDFIFSREMAVEASNLRVFLSVLAVVCGATIMALLGKWA